jgi:hypothetical protein
VGLLMSRPVLVFALQALGMAALSAAFFGLLLRVRGAELAALVIGPALIVATAYQVRSRLS